MSQACFWDDRIVWHRFLANAAPTVTTTLRNSRRSAARQTRIWSISLTYWSTSATCRSLTTEGYGTALDQWLKRLWNEWKVKREDMTCVSSKYKFTKGLKRKEGINKKVKFEYLLVLEDHRAAWHVRVPKFGDRSLWIRSEACKRVKMSVNGRKVVESVAPQRRRHKHQQKDTCHHGICRNF